MKKALSLFLAILMLTTLFVPVSAAAAEDIISGTVLNSITEEEETGLGVAFLFTMNMQNATIKNDTVRTFKSATVTIDGTDYKVVKMGAVVANQEETGTNPEAMVIENVTGLQLLDVEAPKLWDWNENELSYAVRITNVPVDYKKTQIYARPYYIYKDANGEEQVVYGNISNKSYFSGWCDTQPAVKLPTIGSGVDVKYKTSNPDKYNRIRVEDAFIVDRTVTLTLKNYTTNWITEETDYLKIRCYDADGTRIDVNPDTTAKDDITVYIGCIDTKKNKIKSYTFDVPDNTAKVSIISTTKITYWTEWS